MTTRHSPASATSLLASRPRLAKAMLRYSLAGLLAGCSLSGSANSFEPRPRVFTEADNGHTTTLRVGATMQVTLPGNVSTGYSWNFIAPRPKRLSITDSTYVSNPHPAGMVGVPGTQHWTFKALKAGKTVINLAYYRRWEAVKTGDKHFTLTVLVN